MDIFPSKSNHYLFTSESVSEGHPDKVSDQISDAILDEFLRQDPESKVACETFCSTGLVVVGGEVRSEDAYVDIPKTVRRVINKIGYNNADYMFDDGVYLIYKTLQKKIFGYSRFISSQYTESGYLKSDIRMIVTTFILTLLSIILISILIKESIY